jgi:hypothetical protein
MGSVANATHREPWNKGKIVGQKAPFKPKDISIGVFLSFAWKWVPHNLANASDCVRICSRPRSRRGQVTHRQDAVDRDQPGLHLRQHRAVDVDQGVGHVAA